MKTYRYFLALVILLISFVYANGQNADNAAYIKQYQKVAMDEMRVYRIPASITLAQGILESANGKSRLAVKANNHFGIKCASDWNGKKIYHDDDRRKECFRSYPSPWGSYRDHSKFLKNRSRYASLFKLKISDYKGWAHGLKKAGYATDRHYPKRLIDIIENNQLYRFDKMVLEGTKYSQDEIMAVAGPHMIKKHKNKLDYIVIREGDTYESLSNELDIKQESLIEYNDKNLDSPLIKGEIIFIEKKNKKGKNKYYKVQKGDNMYSISQKEGIRLEYLYIRNKIPWGTQPKTGITLYLRSNK